ncbi:hypothetical protein [Burkholderia gladioli]|uniref:hypothetical protein n=1 Tax=Burkholderia gladioli TaxID=28095 RepID=UPI00286F9D67|nr:hypothetical protein [Burkholderia gladioli]
MRNEIVPGERLARQIGAAAQQVEVVSRAAVEFEALRRREIDHAAAARGARLAQLDDRPFLSRRGIEFDARAFDQARVHTAS